MKTLECFAGIGGMALGLERAGFSHTAFVEQDKFCQAVLRKHWPAVPIYDDIRSFDGTPFRGRVDLVSGGPPCQPASLAGKRKGVDDERWLWGEFLRVVREARPRGSWLRILPESLLSSLSGLTGFSLHWRRRAISQRRSLSVLGRSERHTKRDRVWIVAHCNDGESDIHRHAATDERTIARGSVIGLEDLVRVGRCGTAAGTRNLNDEAVLASWPTPNVPNGGRKPKGGSMSVTGMTPDGKKRQVGLENRVEMEAANWPTPRSEDSEQTGAPRDGEGHPDERGADGRRRRTR